MKAPRMVTNRLVREFKVFRAFCKSNQEALYFPIAAYALFGWKLTYSTSPTPISSLLKSVVAVNLWGTIWMYIFDLSNQLNSVEEDRLNKPDRPLPSGLVIYRGAKLRLLVYGGLFISLGLLFPFLFIPTLVWLLDSYMLCFSSLGSHWFFKNIVGMSVSSWVFMTAIARLAGPLPDSFYWHIRFVCAWIGLTHTSQDWRDVIGDTKVGRYTLPIAFGDVASRWIYALVMLPLAVFSLWMGGVFAMAPSFLTVLHMILGYRVICGSGRRDRKYDHDTYQFNVVCHACLLGTISYHYLLVTPD